MTSSNRFRREFALHATHDGNGSRTGTATARDALLADRALRQHLAAIQARIAAVKASTSS